MTPVSESIASIVLAHYEQMYANFMAITRGAQQRFEGAQWHDVHAAMRERLTVYKQKVGEAELSCREKAGEAVGDRAVWAAVRAHYATLIAQHDNAVIAESFFNSVYSRMFGHKAIRAEHVFSGVKPLEELGRDAEQILESFTFREDLQDIIRQMLERFSLKTPYENLERDVRRVASRVDEFFSGQRPEAGPISIRMIRSHFFRNKGAYLIGYIDLHDDIVPVALPFMENGNGEIYVDAVIMGSDELSMIFSFTRSYFMVDAPIPGHYVAILKRLMPQKKTFELFTAIGFAKHGKTAFYQHAINYTRNVPRDQFYEAAPGIKGMVMLVFTLPSFDYVYKVIKDRFTPPKDMTREEVKQKYALVKSSDRAGRMADIYEFKYLAFDRRRFSAELLEELQREVGSLLEFSGNALILKHVYVERKMTPLNLYLPDADDEQTYSAIDEYGNAIKQLAAANIFPGDMLLKNFGVTRHGRVVFYDYDEICPLTDCNFRKIPEPRTEEQEMAAGAWFDVADNDVFPEEFRLFFTGNPRAREVFNNLHADIYDYRWWQELQQRIRDGYVADVFPYRRTQRFSRDAIDH